MKKILSTLLMAMSVIFAANVMAQDYPNKPIKVLVGYAPGGAVDLVARTLGLSLSASLGQTVVVENKPGAGTNIAVKQLIDSPPDGYTLMVAANALAANMSLYKPQPFDIDKDITPIAMIGRVPVVIATTSDSKYQRDR
jgi:tripartite-type tricarboxylate transporter receptor subunit TctC